MTPRPRPKLVPLAEAARELRVAQETVRRKILSGDFRGQRDEVTRKWLVDLTSVKPGSVKRYRLSKNLDDEMRYLREQLDLANRTFARLKKRLPDL